MGNLKFYSYIKNEISAGEYRAEVQQDILINGNAQKTYTDKLDFEVYQPLYEIDEDDIYEIYPKANTSGNYSNQLPYIQFSNSILPWLHTMNSDEEEAAPIPWMALFVFHESDAISINTVTPEQAFENTEANIVHMKEWDSKAASVRYIDIPGELFCKIAPDLNELQYLAHVKYTDMEKKATGDGDIDYLSCVISNQYLNHSDSGTEKIALVCLKGLEDTLNGIDNKADDLKDKIVRLPLLKDWTVEVQPEREDFDELVKNIDYNIFGIDGEYDLIAKGYVPLSHVDRNGNKLVSWYHGPLIGIEMPDDKINGQDFDQYLIYDKNSGMFDVSYSAAFQLGVSLAFSSQDMIQKLEKIRLELKREKLIKRQKELLLNNGVNLENQEEQLMDLLRKLGVLKDESKLVQK